MIDDLLPPNALHTSSPQKRIPPSTLPIIIIISVVSGTLFGFAGGFAALRYFGGFSPARTAQEITKNALVPEPQLGGNVVSVSEDSATIDVVKKSSKAVVSIIISKELSKISQKTGPNIFPFDNFFDFQFPFNGRVSPQEPQQPSKDTPPSSSAPDQKQKIGGGSGFIVSSDGLILTNKHVVSDSEAEYTVVTNEGKEYAAKVLAQDPVNDLAIIKIDAKNLPALVLGDSNTIQIGQTAIAIGNTLGEYRNTVTRGVISGVDRVVQASNINGDAEVIQEAIQTDAAINPGNSGGPLLNLGGQAIGINTAVNESAQSIGFAIPINVAKRSIDSVKKFGKIIRPWLGVRYTLVDAELKKNNNLSVDYGALISGNAKAKELGVIAGSPAEKARLVEGDIILEVDGKRIDQGHALANAIAQYNPGDTVKLKVLSKGKKHEVRVTLEEFKEQKH